MLTKVRYKDLIKYILLFNFEGPHFKRWGDSKHGGVAQLGERLPCTQEVESSNLFISTRGHTPVIHGLIAQ